MHDYVRKFRLLIITIKKKKKKDYLIALGCNPYNWNRSHNYCKYLLVFEL